MDNVRRSGRTTRIIDQLVQDYFNQGFFVAVDHPYDPFRPTLIRNHEIFLMVSKRLNNEHGITIELKDARVQEDKVIYIAPTKNMHIRRE